MQIDLKCRKQFKLQQYFFYVILCLLIKNVSGHEHTKKDQPQDSIWYFHPFSVDVGAGLHMPSGKLATYYNSTLQLSAYMGIMVAQKMRLTIGFQFRGMNQTNPILLKANDTIIPFQNKEFGGGFGAWIYYTVYQNKWLCSELIGGVANQSIVTNVLNKANGDSIVIDGIGLSIGVQTWFHTYKGLNFGLRTEYNYANYDKSNFLAKNIGTNFFNVSLIYRIQPRQNAYKKWYW